jgi:hypothetical protein
LSDGHRRNDSGKISITLFICRLGQCCYAVGEYLRYESVLFDERAGASEEFTLSADTSRSA